jgi:CheY-specific phosphatase CheX
MDPITYLPMPGPETSPVAGSPRSAWIEHFVAAALDVLQAELGLEAWRGQAYPACPSQALGGVRLMVVYGGAALRGVALLAIDDEVATAIAAYLDRQATWTSQYPVQRGMSQLGTTLARGINRRFAQAGRGVKLSAPVMLVGPEAFEPRLNPQSTCPPAAPKGDLAGGQVQGWRVPLHTPLGDMQLYLAWRDMGSRSGQG